MIKYKMIHKMIIPKLRAGQHLFLLHICLYLKVLIYKKNVCIKILRSYFNLVCPFSTLHLFQRTPWIQK